MQTLLATLLLIAIKLMDKESKDFTIKMYALDKAEPDKIIVFKNEWLKDASIKTTVINPDENDVALFHKVTNDSLFLQQNEEDDWKYTGLNKNEVKITALNDSLLKATFKDELTFLIKKSKGIYEISPQHLNDHDDFPKMTLEWTH